MQTQIYDYEKRPRTAGMVYIELPSKKERKTSFYLAMEEYVAREVEVRDAFFIWQVAPSVIFGRNQSIENEVNTEYCRDNGVQMFRRKSGGGCIYADKDNMMLSFVTSSNHVGLTYNRYIMMVVGALHGIGIPVTADRRNDILIDGCKVSGSAFYHIQGRSIVHGTLLYDTDMRNMTESITPKGKKPESKGVKSTRSRITLLKHHTTMSIEEVRKSIIESICDSTKTLTADEVKKIEEIEKEYLGDGFIYGKNPEYRIKLEHKIGDKGKIEARMTVKNDIIKDIDLKSDFFVSDCTDAIRNSLRGIPLNRERITDALADNGGEINVNTYKEYIADAIMSIKC